MTFTTVKLNDERVLVKGTDVFGVDGQTVVDGTQWAELKARKDVSRAQQDFDLAVDEFFKPLTEAADKLGKDMTKVVDPSTYVVLDEPTQGVEAKPGHLVKLSNDSIVLRLIEEGTGHTRLVWVDNKLEMLAEAAVLPTSGNGTSLISSDAPAED